MMDSTNTIALMRISSNNVYTRAHTNSQTNKENGTKELIPSDTSSHGTAPDSNHRNQSQHSPIFYSISSTSEYFRHQPLHSPLPLQNQEKQTSTTTTTPPPPNKLQMHSYKKTIKITTL